MSKILTKEEKRDIQNQVNELKKKLNESYIEETLELIHQNKSLVGKCYQHKLSKERTAYYKVISEYSENQYRVSCFKFVLPFKASITPLFSMASNINPFDCSMEIEPFSVESVMVDCHSPVTINNFEEISAELFAEKMQLCYQELVNFTNRKDIITDDGKQLNIKY